MFLTYLVLGVVLGIALTAVLNTLNQPNCVLVFTGERTVVSGCEHLPHLSDVIHSLNDRLSFNQL